MDAPATAETAAMVVKTVAAKNPALGGETVAAALKKAQEVYAGLAKSDADAGYAVDEIKGLLAKLPQRDTSRYRSNRADGKPWSAIPRPARQ